MEERSAKTAGNGRMVSSLQVDRSNFIRALCSSILLRPPQVGWSGAALGVGSPDFISRCLYANASFCLSPNCVSMCENTVDWNKTCPSCDTFTHAESLLMSSCGKRSRVAAPGRFDPALVRALGGTLQMELWRSRNQNQQAQT